jgi:hypothetical protein
MGRGHAHSKITSGYGGSHFKVYDVIIHERRDKMACNHDIRESENSREQTEVSDSSLSVFYFICGTIFTSHTLSVPHTLLLMIYLLTAHRSNDKYRKMRLDSLSRTHHVQTISGHQAMLRITSSTSLLIPKTNCVTWPTEHQSQELRRRWRCRRHVAHWPMTSWAMLGVAWDVLCKLNNGHFLWCQMEVTMPQCLFSWKPSNRAFYGLLIVQYTLLTCPKNRSKNNR